ncbi:unnamed protein product [Blumeria hordei]|uniref:Uncharacterized protein n=1 Tax=Blumeria hordei TaxID=2867405 RepID=A0A383V0J8_BLUHO|nr:unnamed protein product [Blumeria hordei]
MACIVAFLLTASTNFQPSNHLVLVTSDISDYSYRVFPHQGNEFPRADGIIMSTSSIDGTRTSTAVYCSIFLGSQGIITMITKFPMLQTNLVYETIIPEPEQLQTCWENIKDTVKKLRGVRVKYSELEQTICAPKTISYLAYTGSVLVIGDYQHFFPRRESRALRPIIVSERFSLDQLIENGQIFRRTDWDKESIALAWYQGYLHLFEARLNGWYPLTKTGLESQNGRMILMYMLGTDLEIWNSYGRLSTRINNQLRKLKGDGEFEIFYNRLWDPGYLHTSGKQLDLAKLQSFVPMGKISRNI